MDCLKTYIIQFTHKHGNGWAIVNAYSPNQAAEVFKIQTHYIKPKVVTIKESKWYGEEMQLVYEGMVTTTAMNPYDLAILNGFKGSLSEFLESIRGPEGKPGKKGDPFRYEDFTPEQLEALRGPEGPAHDSTELWQAINDINSHIGEINITDLADLTPQFKTGNAATINTALTENGSKLIYVAPGDYEVDDTIYLWDVKQFYCFGNIIGPTSIPSQMTKGGNKVMRAVIASNGSNKKYYIKSITVRNNYCAFYTYFSRNINIEIGEIKGVYNTQSRYEYRSYFTDSSADNQLYSRYQPISDSWILNSGFTADHLYCSTVNIGGISNLNYGIYLIETLNGESGLSWDEGIVGNSFNINSIVCKKAVVLDNENIISYNNGTYTKGYRDISGLGDRDIHGNVFNIKTLDYTTAPQTNSIETVNDYYYNQSVDNRRVVFYLSAYKKTNGHKLDGYLLANNIFNANYSQGVYDVCVYAKNVSSVTFNMYLQPNDLYFNDGTSRAKRLNNSGSEFANYYTKGTTSGYETRVSLPGSKILVFDNCDNISFNNYLRAFLRPSEIDITNECKNIYINQVYKNDNLSNTYHTISPSNYMNVQNRIYTDNVFFSKVSNDGYFDEDGEFVSAPSLSTSEINNIINTICNDGE